MENRLFATLPLERAGSCRLEVAAWAYIGRRRGRLSAGTQAEKDLPVRTFGPHVAGDEMRPA